MPYIQGEYSRHAIRDTALSDVGMIAMSTGELNFALTMVIKGYLQENGLKYETINDIIGALEAAKLEFYRRVVVPYEDRKIVENGDVYD